jgi:hypothetical protein|tara:strand:- start:128 stop:1975 length:1848 start_codon:yes stop_codon:yes gene_type:complete
MKNYIRNITYFIPTIISIILVFFIWGKINFQFHNPDEIIGYYSINNYSILNDNLRYIFFVLLPSVTFIVSFLYWKKKRIKDLKEIFSLKKTEKNQSKISIVNLVMIIFLVLVYIFSLDFNYNSIDLFHDGQVLVGANNFLLTKKIFQENYIVSSLFIDILNPIISWNLFGVESLSAYRLFIVGTNLITMIMAILYLYYLINFSKIISQNYKLLSFFLLTLITIYFFKNGSFSFRDFPIFIFFTTILLLVNSEKKIILCFIIGLLPLSSLLISLDRGIFLSLIYLFYLLFLILSKQFKNLSYILTSVLFSFLIFFLIIGDSQFQIFLINSIDIIKSSELLNGIIHPIPFSDDINSSRATKSLIIILLNIFIGISILLNEKKFNLDSFKLTMLFMLISSIIYYKIGLTRSDGGHIKQGSSIALYQLIIFILYLIVLNLEKKLILFKNNKNFYIFYTFLILTVIFSNFNYKNLNNILYLKDRVISYLEEDDLNFLSQDELFIIQRLKVLTKQEKCFQVFSYETGIQYYLNKKTCTNFYHIMNMGSKNNQLKFINQMIKAKPKYILKGGNYSEIGNVKNDISDNLYPKNRFPYIYKFVQENYKIFEKYKKWNILVRKGL